MSRVLTGNCVFLCFIFVFFFFFFQAEDGIRDDLVTGVQTCALPISPARPGIDTSPFVGSTSPLMLRNKVDFPAPEAPRSTKNSPCFTSRLVGCKATVEST